MNLLPVFHLFHFFLLWKQDTSDLFYALPQCLAETPCHWACPLPKQRQCKILTPTYRLFLTTPLDLGVHLPTLTVTLKQMRNSVHLLGLEKETFLHILCIDLSGESSVLKAVIWDLEIESFYKSTELWTLSPQWKGWISPLPPQKPSIPPRWGKTSIFPWPVQLGYHSYWLLSKWV